MDFPIRLKCPECKGSRLRIEASIARIYNSSHEKHVCSHFSDERQDICVRNGTPDDNIINLDIRCLECDTKSNLIVDNEAEGTVQVDWFSFDD